MPKFIDLFAGIGGFRYGLESVGFECAAYSEIEKHAISVYKSNFDPENSELNLGDITQVDSLPEHDLLVGGVPCQSWSIAGKNRGINDHRGQLWNDVIRLVSDEQPKAFIFENVKGLVDPRHRDCLESILDGFVQAGYEVKFKLLNSHDFGVPQNRARVFIVGIRSDVIVKTFEWPAATAFKPQLHSLLDDIDFSEEEDTNDLNLFGEEISSRYNKLVRANQKNPFFVMTDIRNGPTSVHSWDIKRTSKREKNICLAILKNRRKPQFGPRDGNALSFNDIRTFIPDIRDGELEKLVNKNILKIYDDEKWDFKNRMLSGGIDGVYRIYLPNSTFYSTLTATGSKDVVATQGVTGSSDIDYKQNFIDTILKPKRYRPLTSSETCKIQGFPDGFVGHSRDSHTKRLLGNAVSPPVIQALAESMLFSCDFSHVAANTETKETVCG